MKTETSNWKLIESAPKDGTWVILTGGTTCDEWYGAPEPSAVIATWDHSPKWEGALHEWKFCAWDGDLRSVYENPTHWMPIPALPNNSITNTEK